LFTERIKQIIKQIPYGKVATYGQIAFMAGNHGAARQVAWVLHSCSEKDNLPWHRVINREGKISLRPGEGYEEQRQLLENEGVVFDENGCIDLEQFMMDSLPGRQF
jgi:methylated-DNA-protein-cysteine methyltransferase-like protein